MYVEITHHVTDDHRETPSEWTAGVVLTSVLAHAGAEELRAALGAEDPAAVLQGRIEQHLRGHHSPAASTLVAARFAMS